MGKRIFGTGFPIALAFAAGVITHDWYSGARGIRATYQQSTPADNGHPITEEHSNIESTKPALPQQHEQKPSTAGKSMALPSALVEVLITKGGLEQMLGAMSLSPEEKQRVKQIQQERVEALKQLEVRYARVVKDADGSHVEIATFPEARQQWLEQMEASLHEVVNDDRAMLLSRLILADGNDTSAGLYRRELRVLMPDSPEGHGQVRLEQQTFDARGLDIHSHYENVDDRSRSRWGQLLDFDAKDY